MLLAKRSEICNTGAQAYQQHTADRLVFMYTELYKVRSQCYPVLVQCGPTKNQTSWSLTAGTETTFSQVCLYWEWGTDSLSSVMEQVTWGIFMCRSFYVSPSCSSITIFEECVCVCVWMCVCVRTHMRACVHACVASVCVCGYVCARAHAHMCACAHVWYRATLQVKAP